MARSSTAKKSRIKNQAERETKMEMVKVAADMVSSYIKSWAQTETQRLLLADTMALIPVTGGFQIGKHRILEVNHGFQLYNFFMEPTDLFVDRRSAILYSILYQTKRFQVADEILAKDQRLSKLAADFQHYSHTMSRAARAQNTVQIDVIAARYYDTEIMLKEAKNELEKTLRLNKYLKVWEPGKPL